MSPAGRPRTAGRIDRARDESQERETAPHQGVAADAISEDIFQKLAELGESSDAVVISREDDQTRGKWNFLARIPVADFSPEWLKVEYGGGDYKLVFIDAEKGALNPVFFPIDRRFKGRPIAVTPVQPDANGSAGVLSFERELLRELVRDRLNNRQAPTAPAVNVGEIVNAVVSLASLFRPTATQPNSDVLTTSLALIREGMEIGRETSGESDPFSRMIGPIGALIERLAAARGSVPPPQTPPRVGSVSLPPSPLPISGNGSHGSGSSPVVTNGTEPPPGNIFTRLASAYGPRLARLADTGASPELYADLAVDQLQEDPDAWTEVINLTAGKPPAEAAEVIASQLFAAVPALGENPTRRTFVDELSEKFAEGVADLMTPEAENDRPSE
jgi:hypothetical protein